MEKNFATVEGENTRTLIRSSLIYKLRSPFHISKRPPYPRLSYHVSLAAIYQALAPPLRRC
ncbi:hypothetical protein E2C01_017394 [Portunus trituberculatus]|uniref:Uncharacterized protein n=1 Tax=Portunus trituberculatus TaxID=210409 RepID=A0A5B7DTJ0_PORTR|nr:hypothetical protein [Portunus trituberculatus]